eukprot:7737863-Pyramimonas_sp.AAC.1
MSCIRRADIALICPSWHHKRTRYAAPSRVSWPAESPAGAPSLPSHPKAFGSGRPVLRYF